MNHLWHSRFGKGLHRAWDRVRGDVEWRGVVHLNFTSWVLLWMQLISMLNMIHFEVMRPDTSPLGLLELALTPLAVLSMAQLSNALLANQRWLRFLANGFMLVMGTVLPQFRAESGASLDYPLIKDNYQEFFNREVAGMALSTPSLMIAVGTVVGCALGIWAEIRFRLISGRAPLQHRWRLTAVAGVVYAAIFALPFYTFHELTYTLQTVARYYAAGPGQQDSPTLLAHGIRVSAPYPYATATPVPRHVVEPPVRPNVVIVLIESFNGNYVGKKTADGREVTPVFNRLTTQGLHVPRFYGNSMQTAKGHFATLCALPPSFRGKEYSAYAHVNVPCLPSLLRDAGYRTVFLTAYRELEFDNTGDFLLAHGMDVTHSLNPLPVATEDRPYVWGWGLQDDRFFQKSLAYLDRLQQEHAADPRPLFVTLATISNHMHFDSLPAHLRGLHKEPRTFVENYENSLNFSDRALGELITQLRQRPAWKDSIIVITGDHSFPMEEHDNHYNQLGAFDEVFRTALVILWDGHIAPTVVTRTHSQNDIAPTLLWLLGLQQPGTMLGSSMLDENAPAPLVFLSQPYDGTHIGVVQFPFKYVLQLRNGHERLYNLALDPHEDRDLSDDIPSYAKLDELRAEVGTMVVNQRLLDQNRIWPPATGAAQTARP